MRVPESTTLVGLALVLLGCPRDQDAPPQDDTSTGSADTTQTNPNTLDSTVTDPTSEGNDSGTTGSECLGADGCYACDPEDSVQLLNHCTDADCEPFANTPTRLPLLGRDGSLPAIP